MLRFIKKIGIEEFDSDETIIQKNFLVYLGLAMSMGGVIWGGICYYFGLYLQAQIPLGYGMITAINFYFFSRMRNFATARFIQTLIVRDSLIKILDKWSA